MNYDHEAGLTVIADRRPSSLGTSVALNGKRNGSEIAEPLAELGGKLLITDRLASPTPRFDPAAIPQEFNRPERRAAEQPSPSPQPDPKRRQLFFRVVRLLVAGGLIAGVILHIRRLQTTVRSQHALINAEVTAMRAPISGELRLEDIPIGRRISAGAILFRIENARFGNQDAMSQLNWVRELAERLRAEAEEASIRFRQQEEIFQFHEKLHNEKLISRLAFTEEQTKLTMARTLMTNKQTLAAQAEGRCREMTGQVELQKEAVVRMPFSGVAWNASLKNGADVYAHETVLAVIDPSRVWVDASFHERHAERLVVGSRVTIRTPKGKNIWSGTVEAVRGGGSRIATDGAAAVLSIDHAPLRISARVKMDAENPFGPSEFFGIGRNVIVTLSDE